MPGMTMGANASGSGDLTGDILKSLLEDLPGEAVLTINTSRGDQRDGPYWSLSATWGEDRSTSPRGTKRTNFNGSGTRVPHPETQLGQFGDH